MKRICTFAFLMILTGQMLFAQKTYLVSVGVCDYPGTSADLRMTVDDAIVIANICRNNSNARYTLLFDSDATCSAIKQSMSSLFSQAGRNDVVILFFSGHGTPEGLVAYDGIVTYEEIRNVFSACACTNKLVFADACYAGRLRVSGGRGNSHSGGSDQNVLFFLSSRSDETSLEVPGMSNGLFTAYLERGLRGGADSNRNRIITARELFDFVSSGVRTRSGDRQHPVMWGNFSDNMPVIKW